MHKGRTCCGPGNYTDIGLLEPGGFADISAQDGACAKGDCVISRVYDQSGHGNHLGQRHMLVNASKHKILIGGKVPVCACSSPFASSLGASQKLLRLHVM